MRASLLPFKKLSLNSETGEIKKKLQNQDKNIELVFSYLDELMEKQENPPARNPIGFRSNNS
ncbi:MAG: hypothetical protein A2W90_14055 [Bacteroidetes bacterium GWF2_42_66]|nr:MAG: hypothetical protein A2W92_21770 [Bacteroidetes bacterium GWA2_42_15]OFX96991.1 MAG: hypothetical protein A2W89_12005 [Bacteroidetes bacterium GWE2_42_39]OFY46009.1 MAG: hypothetical protein A2W90_14055 [Bacteroidetes bacterium GWF2_42_66]